MVGVLRRSRRGNGSAQRRQAEAPDLLAAVTLVQSDEGRDVVTRPLGPTKVSSSLAFPDMAQPFLCTKPW